MPYARPTLTDLRQQVKNDIEGAQEGTDALLRFSPLRISGVVQAGLAHQHYGYLDYIAKQAVPWTATDEYLAGWGALKRTYQKDASTASGAATFPAASGKTLDAGITLVRGDGVNYITTSSTTAGAGSTVTVLAKAVNPGIAGNCDVGSKLTLAQAVDGIQSTGVAATDFKGGAEIEDQDAFSGRVMDAYQSSPQGGAVDDYPGWTTAVSGVTRAWCNPLGFGAGSVVVYFMMDDVEAAHGGFPQGIDGVATAEKRSATKATGDQLIVANAIFPLRPATALVYACAPLKHAINFKINGLSVAGAATQNAVKAALADVFFRNGSPLNGTVNRTDLEGALSGIAAAAGAVITEIDGVIAAITTVIYGNITSPLGYLPSLGDVSFL